MLKEIAYNVSLNGFKNVRLRGLCAAGNTGPDAFWTNFGKPNSFSFLKSDSEATSFSVLKVKLDELFALEGLSQCSYIKIDAEGAEQEILEGAKRIIETNRPIIQAEVSINNFEVKLDNYSVFQARKGPESLSPNRIFIPNESRKIEVAKGIGFRIN
jgi:FkbM family methyltransferase